MRGLLMDVMTTVIVDFMINDMIEDKIKVVQNKFSQSQVRHDDQSFDVAQANNTT